MSPRSFQALVPGDVHTFAGPDRLFTHSTAGDLNGDAWAELVVSADGDSAEPLRIFARGTGSFKLVKNAVELGPGVLSGISGISIGLATAAGSHNQGEDRPALFVTHTQSFAGAFEHRVSTFLVSTKSVTPRVVSPLAARNVADPILGATLGQFFAKSPASPNVAMDAWLAIRDGLISFENDGLGELAPASKTVIATGILPSTLTTVVAGMNNFPGIRSMPAFLTRLS